MAEDKKRFAYFKQLAFGSLGGLLSAALVILAFSFGDGGKPQPKPTDTETTSTSPTPSSTPTNARTCSVKEQAADPLLGTLSGVVINAATKEVLWDRDADKAVAPASVLKLFTAAAALQTLGPNFVIDTKVYADSANPGTIYLVGGGDPTLSATPQGKQSVYKNAPKLKDLAIKVNAWAKQNNITITNIVLDNTLFAGGAESSKWDPSWPAKELTLGYQSQVTALQVDGDRANPYSQTSPRSKTPVMNAGKKFKAALGVTGATLTEGTKPGTA
ncbi:MAG: hypothetical protein RL719_831, partial [Actinomycetota bacterium]